MRNVSIIGAGRIGGALAIALARQGYEIKDLFVRKKSAAAQLIAERLELRPRILAAEDFAEISSDIVFIATPDSEIEAVATQLSKSLRHTPFVFHLSGALSSASLRSAKEIGCRTGSVHPLASFSDSLAGAERFAGAYFCVEGDAEAVDAAKEIVAALKGKPFSIETKYKTLYHASAVTASGHLVALVDTAVEMLARCGMDQREAKETLMPLIKGTVENLADQTTERALTGTFARADVATFEKHLIALEENVSDEAREIYLQLGARSAHLAERQGASAERLNEILNIISLAKKNFKC